MKVLRLLFQQAGTFTGIALVLAGLGGLLSGAGILQLQTVLGANSVTYGDALVIALLGVAQIVASIGARLIFARGLYERVLSHLRNTVIQAVSGSSLRAQETTGNPRLWAAIDSNTLQVALAGNAIVMAARSVTTALACLVAIGWKAPELLPSVLGAVAVGIALYALVSRRAAGAAAAAQGLSEVVDRHVDGLTRGNRELRQNTARRGAFMNQGLASSIRAFQMKGMSSSIWNASAARLMGIPIMTLVGSVLFLSTNGPGQLTTVRSSVAILLFLQAELVATLGFVDAMRRGELALGRSMMTLDALRTTEGAHGSAKDEARGEPAKLGDWSTITLQNVVASYKGEDQARSFTLGPVDLTVKRGEIVFIIGGNGSGKSTLAKVLTGLYVPDSGTLSLDDRTIDNETRESYRQLFSAIFANHHVYGRLFGIEGEDRDERGRKLLGALELGGKVDVKDGMYTTTALSSGQRKRLSMVTARLEDRSILLFDEWPSDQDPRFRDLFYRSILPELQKEGRTILVISHDDRYFESASRLVRLEDGKIVYDGKPTKPSVPPPALPVPAVVAAKPVVGVGVEES